MPQKSTLDRPAPTIDDGLGLSGNTQVILHNDNVNTAEHVVLCLMSIFKHPAPLATKIMLEAHTRGRAIAEVEDREQAVRHATQLQASGLRATVEDVSA